MDSGATSHMTSDKTKFGEICQIGDKPEISLATNTSTKSGGQGTVRINIDSDKIVKL